MWVIPLVRDIIFEDYVVGKPYRFISKVGNTVDFMDDAGDKRTRLLAEVIITDSIIKTYQKLL